MNDLEDNLAFVTVFAVLIGVALGGIIAMLSM